MKSFRVDCNGRDGSFFMVLVFKTPRTMRAHLRRTGRPDDCDAICAGLSHERFEDGKWVRTGWLGDLIFSESSLRMGVVCHECMHAALRWHEWMHAKRKGPSVLRLMTTHQDMVGDEEENACWVAGNIARQIVNAWNAR